MLFSHQQTFTNSEIDLIRGLLEEFIGKDEETCREIIQDHGFIFLDKWNNKLGFVKEEDNRYLILSLYFKESECSFYQVIIKGSDERWLESKIFDSDYVKEVGIVAE